MATCVFTPLECQWLQRIKECDRVSAGDTGMSAVGGACTVLYSSYSSYFQDPPTVYEVFALPFHQYLFLAGREQKARVVFPTKQPSEF